MSILKSLFLQFQAQTSPTPIMLEITKGEGVYLFDNEENKYLDLISGISVSNVGHCAPEVVEAVRTQAGKYMHTLVYGEYVLEPSVRFAESICQAAGSGISVVYFVNSGAEAVEGALKAAKKYTKRKEIIAFKDSYHGSTHAALSVTGNDWIKEGYGPLLPFVKHIRFNHPEDLAQITTETACVIAEPIQAEAGVRMPDKDFFLLLRKRCTETGTVLILDEVQTGFGRTGSLFAFQQMGIVPDIILLAKGMGGGMPIVAFAGKKEILSVLSKNPILGNINTFGGHPVCTAAGLACLNKIQQENLIEKIPAKSRWIKSILTHPAILQISGTGLMYAVELDTFENTLSVVQRSLEKGVITDWFLNKTNALRIAPPLTITEAELIHGLTVLHESIHDVYGNR